MIVTLEVNKSVEQLLKVPQIPGSSTENRVTVGRRVGVVSEGSSLCQRGVLRKLGVLGFALPRDRRCTCGNFPLLIKLPQPFILRSLLLRSRSVNMQRRSRRSAPLPRAGSADPEVSEAKLLHGFRIE